MTVLLGLVMVFGLVFGGFILSGGKMDIVMHALPFEGMMIAGAAIGAFVIANSLSMLKSAGGGVLKVIKGPKWKGKDYEELLSLMYELARIYKQSGILALDDHIEKPNESDIFSRYPKVQHDHFAIELITDSFRMLSMQFDDRFQTEDVINRKSGRWPLTPMEAHSPLLDRGLKFVFIPRTRCGTCGLHCFSRMISIQSIFAIAGLVKFSSVLTTNPFLRHRDSMFAVSTLQAFKSNSYLKTRSFTHRQALS